MPVQVMVSGAVHNTLAYVIVGGAAHFVPQIYVNVGGVIHALYSYYWAVGAWGGCSAACGGGVQYRSVTCARNDGVTVGDEVCSKLVGAKPGTSQGCNTQSCISCRYERSPLTAVVYTRGIHGVGGNSQVYDINSNQICNSMENTCGNYSKGKIAETSQVPCGWGDQTCPRYYSEICGPF